MDNVISFKSDVNTILLSCSAAAESVILMTNMTFNKYTKYWLNKLVIMKEKRRNPNFTFIGQVTLNKNLFKETVRDVVQPISMDSISKVIEPIDSESVIVFVLAITSYMNRTHDLNFHSFKSSLHKNKNEACNHLIIPF